MRESIGGIQGFLEAIDLINRKWVAVKHGEGITAQEALHCFKEMQQALRLIEA